MKERPKYHKPPRRKNRQKKNSIRCRFFLTPVSVISIITFAVLILVMLKIANLYVLSVSNAKSESSETIETGAFETQSTEIGGKPKSSEYVDSSPVLTLEGDEIIKVENFESYEEPGFSATDEEDGDITDNVETTILQKDDYNYEITYQVKDSAGNTVSMTREVRVVIGLVCLTFDDGPSEEITPQILDILEKKGVNATFFVVKYDDSKSELIKREYEDGNVIGFHGYSHDYSTIYTDIDSLMNNFYLIENLVKETTGSDSKIIRFPGGTSNTVSQNYCEGIMTQAVQRVTEEGYTYVDWNIDSNDAGSDKDNSEQIYNNVTTALIPGRTNVVLMHDSSKKQATADALAGIIDYCISNGYDLQTISSDMNLPKHPTNN